MNNNYYHGIRTLIISLALLGAPPAALALETNFGDLDIVLDSSVTLGAAWRAEDRSQDLVGIANGGRAYSTNADDGNLSYDSGDPISAGLKLTSELTLRYRQVNFFMRGTYRYDHVSEDQEFFNAANYSGPPNKTQGPRDLSNKRQAVRDEIGNNLDLLDAYLYGEIDIAGYYVGYRIGKQVLNWGESIFIQNGLNSLIAVNANRLRVPGFDVSELYEPAAMTVLNFDINEFVNVELFYQWGWEKTEIDASGSYWATNDFAGIGGNAAEIGFGRCPENSAPGACAFSPGGSSIPRGGDIEPDDDGQFGVAFHILIPALRDMDLGIYAAKYNSRLPLSSGNATTVSGVAPSARYRMEYPEDIKLYGISFSSVLGDWAVQGEYSLKADQPLQIDEVELFLAGLRVPGLVSQLGSFGPGEFIQGWRRYDVSQIDLSAIRIIGPIDLIRSDQLSLLFEVGAMTVHSMPSRSELRLEGPATYLPANPNNAAALGVPQQDGGYADKSSWGYRVGMRLEYNNVFNLVTLEPTLLFAHDVRGTSPTPILNFIEDRKQVTAGLNVRYLQSWEGGIGYTSYSGGEPFNLIKDRDFFNLFVRYSF